MLVDLKISAFKAVVVGGGSIGERKARRLSEERSEILVISRNFTKGLRNLQRRNKVTLTKMDVKNEGKKLDMALAKADLVIVATNDVKTNDLIASRARRAGALVNEVDNPLVSDFNFPAEATVGTVRIGVSTGGRSPAMAKLLCRKLSHEITRDDQLQVKLQSEIRAYAAHQLAGLARKKALYAVIRDNRVKGLLKHGRFEEAKKIAEGIVQEA